MELSTIRLKNSTMTTIKKERPPTESTLDYLDLDYGQVRPHFSSILSRT
jgi:hypothetical protein